MHSDPLASFNPRVRDWFARSFERPTEAQAQAWPAIARGENVLVSAPTGSGKTLAAFLWGLDRLAAHPLAEGERKTRLVYVSPLKALSYDVEDAAKNGSEDTKQKARDLENEIERELNARK